jgi:hypothetical protein
MLKKLTGSKNRSHRVLKDRVAYIRRCDDVCERDCLIGGDYYSNDFNQRYVDPPIL